jgi:hypothetical protein
MTDNRSFNALVLQGSLSRSSINLTVLDWLSVKDCITANLQVFKPRFSVLQVTAGSQRNKVVPVTLYIPSVTSNSEGSSGGILHPCKPALHFETQLIRSPEAFLTSHTSLSHKNKKITSPVRLCSPYNSYSTSLYCVKRSQTIYQTQYKLYYK